MASQSNTGRLGRRVIGLLLSAAAIPILTLATLLYVGAFGSRSAAGRSITVAYGEVVAILAAVIIVTSIAALILGALLVRRRTARVKALVAATERIAREGEAPLEPDASGHADELEELEHALRKAAAATRKRLDRLTIGAEIDRRMLTSRAIGPVVDLLLESLDRFVDCRFASVAMADFENESVLTVHSANLESGQTYEVKRIQMDSDVRSRLAMLDAPVSVGLTDPLYESLVPSADRDLGTLELNPVKNADKLLGFLALGGCREETSPAVVASLQQRLAMAFSIAEREQTLFVQAHFDPLTNLPNRFLSMDRLEQELARSERGNLQMGLLFIDLDRFKSINDSLGHAAGDALLQVIAERLSECFRDADTVARLGGDEFIVLLPDIDGPKAAGELADRVAESLEEPIMLMGSAVYASASVGIAIFPMDGHGAEQLLRNADAAMYRAKESGSGGKAFFTEEMNVLAQRRVQLEAELRELIHGQELELAFQPQISLGDGSLNGVEVLLRWPGHRVAPDEFVPLAEDTGLIHDIGFWVLETACQALVELGDRLPKLSINVSPTQLRDGHFAQRVLETLSRLGVASQRLDLEISESLLVDNNIETRKVLDELAEGGVGLTMDDFATGHSSLCALPEYPITALKIDRSFVAGSGRNAHDRLLVETVIHLAHGLRLPVVAEGVENASQLELVRKLGCDHAQGFLFSRPISLEQLKHFIAGQATLRAQG